MRSIAIALLGIALTTGIAVAHTTDEQAQVLRDFDRHVADYTQRLECLDAGHVAAPPAPRIFSLPVAMVFRQLIAKALDERSHHAAMTPGGWTMQVLWEALPPLPRRSSTG